MTHERMPHRYHNEQRHVMGYYQQSVDVRFRDRFVRIPSRLSRRAQYMSVGLSASIYSKPLGSHLYVGLASVGFLYLKLDIYIGL